MCCQSAAPPPGGVELCRGRGSFSGLTWKIDGSLPASLCGSTNMHGAELAYIHLTRTQNHTTVGVLLKAHNTEKKMGKMGSKVSTHHAKALIIKSKIQKGWAI